MDAAQTRRAFLEFFENYGHQVVPSASLIPHDPSVLFTIAGMVPFKPYFLGEEAAPWSRATSVQKCFRTVDIDIIGTTTRHCTFFEMLGNFSFGDYFKQGAIGMAWEFVTEILGLEADRLWVTVHDTDDEAEAIWIDGVGLDSARIQRMGEDNFWRMGDTGPCGPCSEIYYDKGAHYGPDGGPAFGGAERFVEIWNLVFMQFDAQSDGTVVPLPKTNIDTGAGLERLVPILNGTDSVFATSSFAGLLDAAQSATGTTYGVHEADDVSLRILADHGRALTMLIADGVLPSNEGRGYVLRRIVRRAVLAARRAGADKAITPVLIDATIASLGEAYPNLRRDVELITSIAHREEEGFDRTLRTGMTLLEEATTKAAQTPGSKIGGDVAFRLHDTHGFPIELTEELAAEVALEVDREEFERRMDDQRERARSAARAPRAADESAYRAILEAEGPTVFVGRRPEDYSIPTRILGVLSSDGGEVEIFVDRTPFYAESGGQMGDTGVIATSTGQADIVDTVAVLPGLVAHRAKVTGELVVGQDALATIDRTRREALARNHTATHLLHWALRQVLGDHVRQQGSLVAPDRLRFDFSHHVAPTSEELAEVTRLVNGQILTAAAVQTTETSRAEAEQMGAVAFFGDKYGETVRVVRAGEKSLEFCGGTHVSSLGSIGSVQILQEGSIGSGTRRIEAITGLDAIERTLAARAILDEAAAALKAEPETLIEAIERTTERTKTVERERDALRASSLAHEAVELLNQAVDGLVIVTVANRGADELRTLASDVQRRGSLRGVAIGSVVEGKVGVALATDGNLDAKAVVKEIGGLIGGGGGGSAALAVAGGNLPDGLDAALSMARSLLGGA